jgi:hypothetical protein
MSDPIRSFVKVGCAYQLVVPWCMKCSTCTVDRHCVLHWCRSIHSQQQEVSVLAFGITRLLSRAQNLANVVVRIVMRIFSRNGVECELQDCGLVFWVEQ